MAADIDAVRKALTPYHGKIHACVLEGFAEWRDTQTYRVSKGYAPNLYSRTNSNDIFDAIMRRAIPVLGAEARVFVKTEAQTAKFVIAGVAARFKKAGEDGLGCNIPTQAAMAFMDADRTLPGLPPETAKIELIWEPNAIWTKVERVLVVARDGDRLLWDYEIVADAGKGEITPLAPTGPSDQPDDASDLVKPKALPQTKPEAQ
ncbi:hypothetical protein [Sphingomonas xinjiangensis]|uniref:Uncharacterized protein n=1 Tax=Sphingomonas xinjiangensis TaxID=643568 RepID=A0A840YTM8_9SPHN|nr:hypothetical protein [Sphingomonas xinjiangensis]MBB5712973.1 hypothetical protein [Sphingomonas xinjiangensis]